MKKRDTDELINIGKIGSSVGLRGEVRVTLYSPDSVNLKEGKVLLLERAERSVSGAIEKVRYQKDKPVVRLKGIEDRNAAEDIRGMDISIYAKDMEELPEGEHYVRDLIGCRVVDVAQGGAEIGVLKDVIQNTAQSILDVSTADGKQVLIPAVDAFLRSIDEEAGVIEVELIPGFLG